MCEGDGTAMCGEPRVATECTYTEREFGRCSRPTVRPGRVNDERDHGDGSSTRPRGRGSWPPTPAIAVPASLASCRCRCRAPERFAWCHASDRASLAAFRASGRDPGTATDVGLRASLRQMVTP